MKNFNKRILNDIKLKLLYKIIRKAKNKSCDFQSFGAAM